MVELEQLATYTSRRVLNSIARRGEQPELPGADRFTAAILFADISGFTDLSDRLGQKGPAGTEELTSIVKECFQAMLGPIARWSGDILNMAGDALIVAWEAENLADLREPLLRAVQCALEIQKARSQSAGNTGLSVRIGIGVGPGELFYVGGIEDHWEALPVGEPFRQMGGAESHAQPGDVVVSPEAWALLEGRAEGTSLGEGHVRIEALSQSIQPPSVAPIRLEEVDQARVEALLPRPVRFLLHGAGEHWMADIRPVTSLFVHVRMREGESITLERLQQLAVVVQKTAFRFEATVSGSSVDEKGMTLMISFGLPPTSHEDDPFRATQAALALRATLRESHPEAGYGIATGRVFCGIVGGNERREFAVMGRTVNLAARLAHYSHGEILCDEATFHPAATRVQFSAGAPLRLKGIPRPIPTFIPTGLVAAGGSMAKMVGHEEELQLLTQAVTDLREGRSFTGLIEGEAGIGKSTLLHHWSKKVGQQGVRLLRGAAESIHATTPYFPWQGIVNGLLGLSEDASPAERRQQFLAACEGQEWERLAPLLNDILDLGIPDNAITEQIAGKMRADNTRELIAQLVTAAAQVQPLAIVLEDCHWMDSASLGVAAVVAQRAEPLMLLLSSRILTGEKEHLLDPLLNQPGAKHLRLQVLDREDCVALAAQRLHVRTLAQPIADLIVARSQGNPFFSVEIAFALRERGLVIIERDQCKPAPGVDLSTVKFPDSVQGIIMGRVDGLAPTVQLTAKVASVVGTTFSAPLLRAAFPLEAIDPQVEANLGVLQQERLVVPEDDEPEYTFAHAIIEEAIYDRLLGAQRKTLHERVALALESHRESLPVIAPLLGHHWLRASDERKAGHYFGLAGQRAVHNGAYQEGLDFLTRALELTRTESPNPGQVQRDAHWHILRAEAFFGLGRIEESWKSFREAASLLGQPVVENPQASQLLKQVGQRLVRGFSSARRCPDDEVMRVKMLAGSYEMLCLLDLFSNRMTSSLSAAFVSLHQAERLGDSPEYARALATMALATSLVPSHFFAERYARAALQVAGRINHASTTARVKEFLGMYMMGEGRWKETSDNFEQAIEGFKLVGDRRREIECTCLLSTWNHYRGDFHNRVKLGQRVFDLAMATGDLQAQAWGLLDQIESLLNLGDFERVRSLGNDLKRHLGQNIYGADEIMAYGLLAALEFRIGRLDEALPYAEKALAVMTKMTPTIVYNLEAYAAVTEIYLKAWRLSSENDPQRATWMTKAREACEATRRFAKVFRIADARALLLTGVERELSGDARQAMRFTREGVASAARIDMPYEKAVAHRQLARLLPRGDRARDGELEHARELFSRLAAKYDLTATESGVA